jgi:tripartite-type tricarboxylate transporter receptor subunit TctC
MNSCKQWMAAGLAALVMAGVHSTVEAQSFPSRPIRLIVPFPPGGPSDIFGRFLAQGMSTVLGQNVIVENRGGAGGVLGVDAAAKAAPDGYTLALNNGSSVAMAPFTMEKMPYDPNKDLAFITAVVKVPEVLVLHPSVPAKTLDELIAYAKAHPGKINFGSSGTGSITHLALELLKAAAHVDIVHVSYKGAAPAVNDLLAGQVQMGIFDVPVVLPHIKQGALRAIAVTSATRSPALPDVPTTVEDKYPSVISDNWYGLVAPARTPPAVLEKLHEAALTTLRSPQIAEEFAKVSGVPIPMSSQEYAAFVSTEATRWGAIIKAIGFKME